MFEKIKTYQQHPRIQQVRDVRVLGLAVFGVIVLLVSWSGVRVIETNYKLQQQIARLEEQNKIQELANDNQELANEYYKTDQYLELQARKQFGKAAPGETLVLVPKHVALAQTVESPKQGNVKEVSGESKPRYQQNFEAWMNFLFRQSAT